MPFHSMPRLGQTRTRNKRRRIHVWKLAAVLLLLFNIIVIIAWSSSAHALKTTRNIQREAFGQHYSYIIGELKSLITQNINGENIPEESREQLISSIVLLKYTGEQLEAQLNKHDTSKLNMIVVVLNSLQQSIQNKQFQNYCHLSDSNTVKDLSGYVYLLDQLPNNGNGDNDNAVQVYKDVIEKWPYRTINELYSSCSLKQS